MELCSGRAWLCAAPGLALPLSLQCSSSLAGKDGGGGHGILYVMGGCFGERFDCLVERISSGDLPLVGSQFIDFGGAMSAKQI